MISGFLFQSFFASACCMGRYFGWGSGGLAVNMIIVFAGRRDKVLVLGVVCPPERLLIAPLYSGGAIRRMSGMLFSYVVFYSVCSFAVFPSGYKNTSRSVAFGLSSLIALRVLQDRTSLRAVHMA